MYDFLIDIGFIDITDKVPIKFTETLIGVDSYWFDKRFIKSNGEIITMVIIGNDSTAYKVAFPAKYQEEVIKNLIQANEKYVTDRQELIDKIKKLEENV
jgi:hypothetical protein